MAKNKYDKTVLERQRQGKRKLKARKPYAPYVGFPDEITTSAWIGLVVTVKNALSLVTYLAKEHSYLNLMTRRLNQDALEVCGTPGKVIIYRTMQHYFNQRIN